MNITPNPICHCSNLKPKLLSVKVNNKCNGNCFFCIDKGGYDAGYIDVQKMADAIINETEYQIVTLTGGEPFLNFPEVYELLKLIRLHKKEIILNTNGSLLTPHRVVLLNGLIDELRIALHHFEERKNSNVIKTNISFEQIATSLQHKDFKATYNLVITKLLENNTENAVDKLVDLCKNTNVDALRISELKFITTKKITKETYDKNHVRAYEFFKLLNVIKYKSSEELVRDGCIDIFSYRDIEFHLKRLCGFKIKETIQTFKVVYSNGKVSDDWIYEK